MDNHVTQRRRISVNQLLRHCPLVLALYAILLTLTSPSAASDQSIIYLRCSAEVFVGAADRGEGSASIKMDLSRRVLNGIGGGDLRIIEVSRDRVRFGGMDPVSHEKTKGELSLTSGRGSVAVYNRGGSRPRYLQILQCARWPLGH